MIKIKRPIILIALGNLIGIIYGLYFEKSIALAFVAIFIIYIIILTFVNIKQFHYFFQYLKLVLKINLIVIFCISAIISNAYLIYLNKKFEKIYRNDNTEVKANAVVISEKEEKEYTYSYTVKIKDGAYKNKKFIIYVKKNNNNLFKYGDLIELDGKYIAPDKRRNYQGFDYSNYLKTKKIYGIINVNNAKFIRNKDINILLYFANLTRNFIIEKTQEILPKDSANLLIGIILGKKDNISEDVISNFKNSNLSHMLAVSGMHTTYLIMRNNVYFKKMQNFKKMDIFNY